MGFRDSQVKRLVIDARWGLLLMRGILLVIELLHLGLLHILVQLFVIFGCLSLGCLLNLCWRVVERSFRAWTLAPCLYRCHIVSIFNLDLLLSTDCIWLRIVFLTILPQYFIEKAIAAAFLSFGWFGSHFLLVIQVCL